MKEESKIFDPKKLISPKYSSEKIFIKNFEMVKNKLKKIKEMGKENINIFADFDFSLTRKDLKKTIPDSSFRVIASVSIILVTLLIA